MKKITATIERNDNNYYQISSDDEIMDCCFGGYGYSVDEAKKDFYESIEEAKEIVAERGGEWPREAEEISVEFRYDLPSFFNCFDWINVSQFAKRAGINESQMRQYKAGIASASEATMRKIMGTIRKMSAELQAVTM